MIETPSLAREVFFSADMPADKVYRYFTRLQNESYWASLDATFFDLPRPGKITRPPMLVMSGTNDILHSRSEIEATARAYGAHLEFIPNVAHMMMLEADWMNVAERILKWLRNKGL